MRRSIGAPCVQAASSSLVGSSGSSIGTRTVSVSSPRCRARAGGGDLGGSERVVRMRRRIALHDAYRDQVGIARAVIVIVLVVRHRRLLHALDQSARAKTAVS